MVGVADESDPSMLESPTIAMVRSILEHPSGRRWVMQDLGLLALWLDEGREHRLHLWDPGDGDADPLIHDHPFDFTSTVVAGEITNTRYEESPAGVEYQRDRYAPPDEEARRTD